MSELKSINEYRNKPVYKDEIAKSLYPGMTYDTAIPQEWLDKAAKLIPTIPYHDILFSIVWGYPEKGNGGIFGRPMPLTQEGEIVINTMAQNNQFYFG